LNQPTRSEANQPPGREVTVAAVLTVSDGVSRGYREDRSGAALVELLQSEGFAVTVRKVVPDDAAEIGAAITELAARVPLVVTTGGTGLGPRDVTPEATRRVLDREAPGLVMLMLSEAIRQNPMAALSRAVVGTIGASLVVNLPGSPRGAVENLTALLPILPHALALLGGDTEHRPPSS
jgi:molybdenum cofactor synthesis domain-containing protein